MEAKTRERMEAGMPDPSETCSGLSKNPNHSLQKKRFSSILDNASNEPLGADQNLGNLRFQDFFSLREWRLFLQVTINESQSGGNSAEGMMHAQGYGRIAGIQAR